MHENGFLRNWNLKYEIINLTEIALIFQEERNLIFRQFFLG